MVACIANSRAVDVCPGPSKIGTYMGVAAALLFLTTAPARVPGMIPRALHANWRRARSLHTHFLADEPPGIRNTADAQCLEQPPCRTEPALSFAREHCCRAIHGGCPWLPLLPGGTPSRTSLSPLRALRCAAAWLCAPHLGTAEM